MNTEALEAHTELRKDDHQEPGIHPNTTNARLSTSKVNDEEIDALKVPKEIKKMVSDSNQKNISLPTTKVTTENLRSARSSSRLKVDSNQPPMPSNETKNFGLCFVAVFLAPGFFSLNVNFHL